MEAILQSYITWERLLPLSYLYHRCIVDVTVDQQWLASFLPPHLWLLRLHAAAQTHQFVL